MSRSKRRAVQLLSVWFAMIAMVIQPSMAGCCGENWPSDCSATYTSCAAFSTDASPCGNSVVYYSWSNCELPCAPAAYGCGEQTVVSDGCWVEAGCVMPASGCQGVVPEAGCWDSCTGDPGCSDLCCSVSCADDPCDGASACPPSDDACCGGYVADCWPWAASEEGYVASYLVDSGDCGCGVSVMADEVHVDPGVWSGTTVVEEGSQAGSPVDGGSVGSGTRIQDPSIVPDDPRMDESSETRSVQPPAIPEAELDLEDDRGYATEAAPAIDSAPAIVEPAVEPAPVVTQPDARPAEEPVADVFDELMPDEAAEDLGPAGDLENLEDDNDFGDLGSELDADVEEGAMEVPGEEEPGLEELFDETPSEDPPADEVDSDLDDLFGLTPAAAGTPATLARRTWIDNTGRFTTIARLVQIGTDSIRILKVNGRHCTVPLNRLSAADLDYVQVIARRQGTELKVAAK